jgi:hypothetical protein
MEIGGKAKFKKMATEQKREGDWPLPPAKNKSFSRRALEFN